MNEEVYNYYIIVSINKIREFTLAKIKKQLKLITIKFRGN